MSYHGYISYIKNALLDAKRVYPDFIPRILEIGLDRGVTTISMTTFLARNFDAFAYVGIDILVQESLKLTMKNIDLASNQFVYLFEMNSLEALKDLSEEKMKYDIVLLDGDHNYYTVSNELKLLENVTTDHTMFVIDDYHGKWSERDMWYVDRSGYENVTVATKKVETEKHGVKAAVDEWLEEHPGWNLISPLKGEPALLIYSSGQ